jgi:hypothetical protein
MNDFPSPTSPGGGLTLTWRRYTAKDRKRRTSWGSHMTIVVGVTVAVGCGFWHIRSMEAVGVGVAMLFLPFYLPSSRRLAVVHDHVALKRQRPWRNFWLWLPTLVIAMFIALIIGFIHAEDVGRPLGSFIVGVLVIVPTSLWQAYTLRGPLRIDGVSVRQGKFTVPLSGATMDVVEGSTDAVSMARITPAPGTVTGGLTSYTIDPWSYGLDINTLASTLAQMLRWLEAGRTAMPAEILAMLTADAPVGVTVGDSVELPLHLHPHETGSRRRARSHR